MGGRRFDAKKGKDLRTYKLDEIKKSLTHRARLRKNYFKLLKNEDPKRYEEELKKSSKLAMTKEMRLMKTLIIEINPHIRRRIPE